MEGTANLGAGRWVSGWADLAAAGTAPAEAPSSVLSLSNKSTIPRAAFSAHGSNCSMSVMSVGFGFC